MTVEPAGTEVDYTVTFLEMEARPKWGWPHLPLGVQATLLRAEAPPYWYFLALYDAVGRAYAWEDMHAREPEVVAEYLKRTTLFTLIVDGWPQGFFLLDGPKPDGVTELDYLGLVPQAVGRGLGKWILRTAILTAWETTGTQKLIVDTCTLDHPRALALYQKNGFTPVRQETRSRILTRDRDVSTFPS